MFFGTTTLKKLFKALCVIILIQAILICKQLIINYLFIKTIKTDISEGETPEILEA